MPQSSAASPVWTLFNRDVKKNSATCKKCGSIFTKPSTSTLRYHSEKTHFIRVPKNPSKKRGSSSNPRRSPEDNGSSVEDNDLEGIGEVRAEAGGQRRCDEVSVSEADGPSMHDDSGTRTRRERSGQSTTSTASFEGPFDRCLSNAQAFSRGGHRDNHATNALLYMIAHDDMPLCSSEKEGLREYTKALQPLYRMPSEPTTTKKIEEKYKILKSRYGVILEKTESLCLTVDVWTDSKSMQSYLGVTAHFRKDINLVSVELGVRFMPERKTTENLRTAMQEICREWQIDYKKIKGVVSDGGANIKATVREEFGADKHISCAAHMLNLVGQTALDMNISPLPTEIAANEVIDNVPDDEDEAEALLEDLPEEEEASADSGTPTSIRSLLTAVKRIVRFFRTSDVATSELKEAQLRRGRDCCLKLVQEVRTRWNSAFYMLDRFLELVDEVTTVLLKLQRERGSTKRKPPSIISGEHLEILTEVRDLLKPLEEATKMLCQEKAVTLSNVIPIIYGLRKDTEKFLPTHGVVLNLQSGILREIDRRFSGIELLRPYAAATILDPRYKQLVFENTRAVSNILSHLSTRINAKVDADGRELDALMAAAPAEGNPESSSGIWAAVDEKLRGNTARGPPASDGMHAQLKAYLSGPIANRKSHANPLATWKAMRGGLEHVYELAMEYLPIMATSVASERLFSHAGLISTQRRSRLSPKHLNMLVFLRSVPKEMWFE